MSNKSPILKLIATTASGLEAVTKRELLALGFEPQITHPGRITFSGSWEAIVRANLWLRTADRILIELLQFPAADFDALFETIRDFDFSDYIPSDGAFTVSARSRNSQLTSLPAIQRAAKKAMVESLMRDHGATDLPESGQSFSLEVSIQQDLASLTLDTTGSSLQRRGYRHQPRPNSIKETLAAALIDLSVWNPDRLLLDPYCGDGVIPIEAAMIGLNIAPGLYRNFSCSHWPMIPAAMWEDAKSDATSRIIRDRKLRIIGQDREEGLINQARVAADKMKVGNQIRFEQGSFENFQSDQEYGCIVTLPPCPEKMEDQNYFLGIYQQIPGVMQRLPTWSLFVLTSLNRFEMVVQKDANRRRKLYLGPLECTYYQYLGPRPPRAVSKEISTSEGPSVEAVSSDVNDVAPTSIKASSDFVDRIPVVIVSAEGKSESGPVSIEMSSPVSPAASVPISVPVSGPVSVPVSVRDSMRDSAPVPSPIPGADSVSETLPVSVPTLVSDSAPSVPTSQAKTIVPLFGGQLPKDFEQAELFKVRLTKNARHLRRWPQRGVTCFRLYERDIPEIPLVVDRYEGRIHITEYERPHERDLARHAAWLELMRKSAAEALDVPLEWAYLKSRVKDLDQNQYEKLGSSREFFVVNEGDLKFNVNLTDYVDTGLFLDHRITRGMVRKEAAGKDFLNLFAYTGSFSVYAAAGGAKSTTTVDLSKNYLQWAENNFRSNRMAGPNHRFIASDSLDYLRSAASRSADKFDLAVVDPPTYSNSKRTEEDWDVQKDHVELLTLLRKVMREGGVVYFSNNFRRFKLDEAQLAGYQIREISKQTLPEDFRNKRIHRCWRMVVG